MDRFGWIGCTRRDAAREYLLQAVQEWLGDWCIRAHQVNVAVEETTRHPRPVGGVEAGFSLHGAVAFLALESAGAADLAGWFAGLEGAAVGDFAEGVVSDALCALATSVVGTGESGAALPEKVDSWPAHHSNEPAWGASWWLVSLDDLRLVIALNRGAIDRIAPPREQKSCVLQARKAGLDEVRVPLEVVLPLGKARLGDVRDLTVGDLLVTECALDAAVELRIVGRRNAAVAARLGRRSERYAAVIEAASTKSEEA